MMFSVFSQINWSYSKFFFVCDAVTQLNLPPLGMMRHASGQFLLGPGTADLLPPLNVRLRKRNHTALDYPSQ